MWPSLNSAKTTYLLSLDKMDLKRIIGVLTGFFQVRYILARFTPGLTDECRSCEGIDSVENIHHLLCDCQLKEISLQVVSTLTILGDYVQ